MSAPSSRLSRAVSLWKVRACRLITFCSPLLPRSWATRVAWLYLAAIPLFACLYTSLPRGFYHANIRFESLHQETNEQLKRLLTESLNVGYSVYHKEPFLIIDNAKIKPVSVFARSIQVEGDSIQLHLMLTISRTKTSEAGQIESEWFVYYPVVSFIENDLAALSNIEHRDWWLWYVTLPALPPESLEMRVLTKYFDQGYVGGVKSTMILLSTDAKDTLKTFMNITRGLPYEASDDFLRMLYLSAVTITTLGYGDIVPITTAARLSIAVEAVLGIVLAGLFINFAFQDQRKRRLATRPKTASTKPNDSA